ncbi:YVTN repeat-like/Quino protein amine dehydrogenase [Leucogyrophana mollusca]|uniref:YVTN repeat-like/Quino protein amine dehydrogenase n=1 Tax=Leucogyrophana mollusca TaxID=85980 RepID=A0ACB8BXD8_9AGAM|nr:YVTN repeat-like/Quino protein amine dehydrogenase [Leucogyrophana mollusca]
MSVLHKSPERAYCEWGKLANGGTGQLLWCPRPLLGVRSDGSELEQDCCVPPLDSGYVTFTSGRRALLVDHSLAPAKMRHWESLKVSQTTSYGDPSEPPSSVKTLPPPHPPRAQAGSLKWGRLKVLRASGIPSRKIHRSSKFSVVVSAGEHIWKTKECQGNDPEWNETFELNIQDSTVLHVAVVDRVDTGRSSLRGETSMTIRDIGDIAVVDKTFQLQKEGRPRGEITLAFERIPLRESVLISSQDADVEAATSQPPSSAAEPARRPQDEIPVAVVEPVSSEDASVDASGNLSATSAVERPAKSPEEVTVAVGDAHRSVSGLTTPRVIGSVPGITGDVNAIEGVTGSPGFALVFGYVETLVNIGGVLAEVHPWAALAWSVLSVVPKTIGAQMDRDQKVQQLWSTTADMLSFLHDAEPVIEECQVRIVSEMMQQIYECALFVREYCGKGFAKRALRDSMSPSTDSAIEQYNVAFKELKEQFKSRSELVALRIFKDIRQGIVELSTLSQDIKDLERTMLLENLPGTDLAGVRCDINRICLPNTRQGLLSDIMAWVADPSEKQAFWLHGVAGTGKSTIANTVAARFAKVGRLGASFRFNRDVDGRNGPAFLFGSIAYQLASFSSTLKDHILAAVKAHGKMMQFSPREQLQKYIIEPMSQIAFSGLIVIVLDALDECGGERDRQDILGAIREEMANFPRFVKLFLVSRHEVDIRSLLERGCLSKSIDGVDGTARDILSYISAQMLEVADRHALPSDWLEPETKAELARHADGLFIWASVACDFILRSDDPMVALHYMVSSARVHLSGRGDALDALYTGILKQASTNLPSSVSTSNLRNIIGAIVTAKTPLTQQGLDLLLGLNVRVLQGPILLPDGSRLELTTCSSIIARLGSMLRKDDGLVRVLHASMFDFFTSQTRCTDSRFYIDKELFSRFMASRCFDAMCVLKRDICGINDPTKMNQDVEDLPQRLQENVPEHVRYGCLYWHLHLADVATEHQELFQEAKDWLSTHLLHWFEVMSLRGDASGILITLDRIMPWFQRHSQSDEVLLLLEDASRFVRQFYEPIWRSAAHIYASAIPFTSRHSSIFKQFAPMLKHIPRMLTDLPESPSPLLTLPVRHGFRYPATSPNVSRFTWVDDYTTLQIWDLNTCSPTGVPLIGHRSTICGTSFSDDGTKVASVDLDGVIFVWDTVEYRAVGGPFRSHEGFPKARRIHFVGDCVVLLCVGGHEDRLEVRSYLTWELVTSYQVQQASFHGRYILTRMRGAETYSILDALTGMDNTPAYARSIGLRRASFPAHSQVRRVACQLVGGEIRVFSTETGALVGIPIPEHLDVLMSPCGQWLAARAKAYVGPGPLEPMSVIDIYSANTGKQLMSRRTQNGSDSVFWSIDGLLFLAMSCSETTFEIWDMETMTHIATLQLPIRGTIHRVSRQRIMFRSPMWVATSVTVWDIASLAIPINRQPPSMKHLQLSPTGEHALVTMSDGTMASSAATWPCMSFVMEDAKHPVSFSPDGTFVATASSGDDLLVWNPSTGKLRQRLCGVGHTMVSLAISLNNTCVVAASDDGRMHLWDVASGRQLCTTQNVVSTKFIKALYLCADGRRAVYLNEGGLGMVDIMTSQSTPCDLPDNRWRWAELSKDATQITCVSGSGNTGLLDGVTGQILKTSASNSNGSVVKVVWSPIKDSFVAVRHINLIQIFGQCELSLVCPTNPELWGDNKITELVFSNDGLWLAAWTPYMIYVWDMQGRCLAWKKQSSFPMASSSLVAFVNSESRCRLLVLQAPNRYTTINDLKLFEVDTGSLLLSISGVLGVAGGVERAVMSSDEAQAVFFDESGGGVAIELSTGVQVPFSPEHPPTALQPTPTRLRRTQDSPVIAHSSDGKTSAFAHQDHTLGLFNMETGAHQLDLAAIRDSSITVPTFSNDGRKIAWVIRGGTVQVWDKATGTIMEHSSKHLGNIVYLAFSPLANHVICVSPTSAWIWGLVDDDLVTIYSGDRLNAGDSESGGFKSAAFLGSHAKGLLIGRDDLRVWDTSASPSLCDTALAGRRPHSNVLLSPDGSQVLINNALYLVDTATLLTQIHKSFDLQWSDSATIFSSDSRYLAQWRYHHIESLYSAEITDVSDGSCMCRLTSPYSEFGGEHTGSVLLSPDCSRLIALFTNGDICVWHLGELPHLTQERLVSSSSFPRDSLFPALHRSPIGNDGWLMGKDGQRLLWIPDEMRRVKLLTARRHGRLVLGRATYEASAPIVLDMSDYLTVPQVAQGWREGGVRIYDNRDEVKFRRAVAYMEDTLLRNTHEPVKILASSSQV